jgi:hypothetical protein
MRAPNFLCRRDWSCLQIGTTVAAAMAWCANGTRHAQQLLVAIEPRGPMLGKLVPYLCIGMAMAWSVHHHAVRFFRPNRRQCVRNDVFDACIRFALLSLGLLVGTKAENQMRRSKCRWCFCCRAFFSDSFSPEKPCRGSLRVRCLFPTTYFIALMRAIILRGANFLNTGPCRTIVMSNCSFSRAAVPEKIA